jgi:hypothetical protein
MINLIYRFFKILYCILLTLPRDLRGFFILRKIKSKVKYYGDCNKCMPDVFMEWVKKQPKKACIIDATRNATWTFQDVMFIKKEHCLFKKN